MGRGIGNSRGGGNGMTRVKKIKFCWTCSDFIHHEHRWKWTAWLCGRVQYLFMRRVI